MLTPKTPPSVGDAPTDRVIRQIYNDINEIIEQLNKANTPTQIEGGKIGEARIERLGADNEYVIRFRSQDGWLELKNASASTGILTFKDKTS